METMEQLSQTQNTVEQTKTVLQRIGESVFDGKSLLILLASLATAMIVGAVMAQILRGLSRSIAKAADVSTDLATVNRLRRLETSTIIAIAIIRLFLLVVAVYFWWVYTHEGGSRPSAVIGAGALTAVLLGGMLTPLLRDFSFGAGMMAERWFGVGDLISIDFPNVQGVVERITLRSTRIRGLNGEIIWVANQTMNGVRVAQKGVRLTAVELFVTDPEAAQKMVDRVNKLLPGGLSLLVAPLRIVEIADRGDAIWHITAIGETAPGREWILEKTALETFIKLDEKRKKPILIVDPIARYADPDMERQLARAVRNARKKRRRINYRQAIKPLVTKSKKSPSSKP